MMELSCNTRRVVSAPFLCGIAVGLLGGLGAACDNRTGDSDCTRANHCEIINGTPTCDDGYVWEDPNDAANLKCVESPCLSVTDAEFCAYAGKNCGLYSGFDRCQESRSANCGDCAGEETCGGTDIPNVCGVPPCIPETDNELCDRMAIDCGDLTADDNCGDSRSVDCGACPISAWYQTVSLGSYDYQLFDVTSVADGGFLALGSRSSNASYLVRFDGEGTILWEKKLTSSSTGGLYALAESPLGGFVLTGTSDESNTDGEVWVVKVSSEGTMEWQKSYDHVYEQLGERILVLPDGEIIVGGLTSDFYAKDSLWILRLSSSGSILWEKSFGDDDLSVSLRSMILSGSQILMSGSVYDSEGGLGAILLSLDPDDGTHNWARKIDATSGSSSLCATSDGDTAIVGTSEGGSWINVYDDFGTLRWGRGFSSSYKPVAVSAGDSGELTVVGNYYGDPESIFLFRLTGEGIPLWKKELIGPDLGPGGLGNFDVNAGIATPEGGMIVAGRHGDGSNVTFRGLLWKIDSECAGFTGCSHLVDSEMVLTSDGDPILDWTTIVEDETTFTDVLDTSEEVTSINSTVNLYCE